MSAILEKPRPQTPSDVAAIYSLADHLDATLAMGEDLLKQSLDVAPLVPGDANDAIAARQGALSDFAQTVRALELGMTARLLQARQRATEIRHSHAQFAPLIGLFIGGTAPLADAAAGLNGGLGDISGAALTSGPEVLAFLQGRALAGPQTASLGGITRLDAGDGYLLAGQIALGTLLDMIAAFLESLDLAFGLYDEPQVEAA